MLYQYFDLTFNFLISGTKLYPTFVTNRYVDCRGEIADKRKSGASKALVVSKFKSIIILSYVDSVVTLYYNIIYLPRINRTFFCFEKFSIKNIYLSKIRWLINYLHANMVTSCLIQNKKNIPCRQIKSSCSRNRILKLCHYVLSAFPAFFFF